MSDLVLETHNLSKQFGDFVAVDGVDLRVPRGVVFGFLGPNGAGKTTTISMVLGLLHATAGQVEVFGELVNPGRTHALRRVGSLVGAAGMVPYLSGRDNLRMLSRLHPDVDDRRVDEVLDQVGLRNAANRKFQGYSTGMKQRLGLGAALLHRPALLILDEPTNGLDPAGMREVRELLRALAADGITVFLSSHLLHEVEQVCDQLAVINRGKMVAQGSVHELLGEQKVVRAWVPSPAEAVQLLQTLPGARAVRANGTYVEVGGVPSEDVILHLVDQGIVPSQVINRENGLEEVFFQLTEEQI
jgi:ABC-type multidrug transport system ATPase subunit